MNVCLGGGYHPPATHPLVHKASRTQSSLVSRFYSTSNSDRDNSMKSQNQKPWQILSYLTKLMLFTSCPVSDLSIPCIVLLPSNVSNSISISHTLDILCFSIDTQRSRHIVILYHRSSVLRCPVTRCSTYSLSSVIIIIVTSLGQRESNRSLNKWMNDKRSNIKHIPSHPKLTIQFNWEAAPPSQPKPADVPNEIDLIFILFHAPPHRSPEFLLQYKVVSIGITYSHTRPSITIIFLIRSSTYVGGCCWSSLANGITTGHCSS